MKARSTALMLNGYVDFFETNGIKLFTGAGVGGVKTTAKQKITSTNVSSGQVTSESNEKYKTKNALAYALHFGASTKVVDNVNVELAYSWKNLGSIEDKTEAIATFPYRGHHLTVGIRYDI